VPIEDRPGRHFRDAPAVEEESAAFAGEI